GGVLCGAEGGRRDCQVAVVQRGAVAISRSWSSAGSCAASSRQAPASSSSAWWKPASWTSWKTEPEPCRLETGRKAREAGMEAARSEERRVGKAGRSLTSEDVRKHNI